MRTESTPLGKYDEAFNALFWEAHPYEWPVVGWASDIPSYTKAQADDYFATYYAPNNLTGVLVGDFKTAEVKPLLERYFGRIPRGKTEPPEVVTIEPKQIGEKRFNAEAETSPTVRIWWHGVPFVHKDRTALDLLSDVLLRPHRPPLQGPRAGPAGGQRGVGLGRPQEVRRHRPGRGVVKDGKDPAAVEAGDLRGDRAPGQASPCPPRSCRR